MSSSDSRSPSFPDRNHVFRLILYVFLVLLMSNLEAILDLVLHSEISYFNNEHLIDGGITALTMIFLLAMLEMYIARRKQTERTLRESENRFATVFRASPVCTSLTRLSDGNILDINDAYLRLFGYDRAQVIGRNPQMLNMWVNPDDRARLVENLRERGRVDGFETTFRTKSGEIRNVIVISEVVDVAGEQYILGLTLDITERKRAEEEIRKNEEHLRVALAASDMAVFNQDLDLRYSWMYQPQLGYTPEQVIGKRDAELLPPDLAQQITELKRQVLETGVGTRGEVEGTLNDKSIYYDLVIEPLRNNAGQIVGVTGASLDITKRKRAEEALREREEQLATILRTATDGFWVTDHKGQLLEVNDAVCRNLGYSRNELLRMSVSDIEAVEKPEEIFQRVQRIKERGSDQFEGLHRRKDGSLRNVEISVNYLPPPHDRYFAFHRDITDRKRTEDTLRESEERFRVLSEQSPLGMSLIDRQGRYEYVNPAFVSIFGYTLQEVPTGADWFRAAFPDPDARREAIRAWKEDLASSSLGEARPRIIDVTCKDGARKIILFRPVTLSRDRQFVIYEDVTRQRELQAQLQQAMKMEAVGHLAGGVAHDFNNLLTVITGYSELLLQKIGKESPMHGEVEEIKRAGERAASLTQQLLAFSRKQIIKPKVLHLDSLVAEMHKMLTRLIGEDIALQSTTGKSLGSVKVDPGQFQQILMNLVVNALDAMPDGWKIVIETSNADLDEGYCALHQYVTPGRFVMLSVSDTGTGMDEEVKKHIFEPFFTTKERGRGTGLGLATTYGAVKQSGGSIEVYSEAGIGTTFKIYLPRVEEEVIKPVNDERPTDHPVGTETVLIVEDEGILRNLCVQILEPLGYRVLQARNGTEAIAEVQEYSDRIDLLLTDVVMPGMNGRELATQLALRNPEMKVLFTSGYTEDVISHHGVLAEGVSFIGKPYTPSALARKVREVLDKA